MHAKAISGGLALMLMAVAAPAAAVGPPSDAGPPDDAGGFPGLPDQALFGICKAFGHADDNATAAPPFQWLTSLGGACDDVSHPSERADEYAQDDEDEAGEDDGDGRPDHAGPPGS